MRIESKLCHISENKAVVKVNGWLNDKNVGSALAEAATVDIAEDKAISRLKKRLDLVTKSVTKTDSNCEDNIKDKFNFELNQNDNIKNFKLNDEPSDWSNILASIDSEIERLNWSRVEENNYLEQNLGYKNRNKITRYKDIISYLKLLKKIDCLDQSKQLNSIIISLIAESDNILKDLSWDNKQGREYLLKEFNVSTRKELNEEQLFLFVENLKSIRNQNIQNKGFQDDK